MWDKGCCLLHALAFTIQIDKKVMEVTSVFEAARDYDKVSKHTCEKRGKICNNFWIKLEVSS
jgi:hypothetical protein